jgi:hypothetical protein
MLCLRDSIRHADPAVQSSFRTIDKAQTLAQLLIPVWPLACVLPSTASHMSSPNGPNGLSPGPHVCAVGAYCAVRALPHVSSRVCVGHSAGDDASDGVRTGVTSRRSPLALRSWGATASADERGTPVLGLCARGLGGVCHRGAGAGVVLWWGGEPTRAKVLGTSGWPPGQGTPPGRVGRRLDTMDQPFAGRPAQCLPRAYRWCRTCRWAGAATFGTPMGEVHRSTRWRTSVAFSMVRTLPRSTPC